MISANGGLPAHRYTPQVTSRWPRGSEPASQEGSGPGHCARRAAEERETTNHIPWVGCTRSTQPTQRASSRGGTPRPLVRAEPGCIGDHGKRHPEPWKQPVTGEPVHSPGGVACQAQRPPNSSHRGEAVIPKTSRSNTPCGERYSIQLGSPQSCRPKEGACDSTQGHMSGHPPTRDIWTGWPRHCFHKHLRERLKRQLN